MNPSLKFLAFLVAVAVLLAGGWYFLMARIPEAAPADTTGSLEEEGPAVVVEETDLAATGSNLPAGFPSGMPVETGNITESYRVAYNDRGVVQYSVSFTSRKSRNALWDEFNAYMGDEGYAIDQSATSKSLGQLSGEKGSDSLSVVLSTRGGMTLAQINFLDRQ